MPMPTIFLIDNNKQIVELHNQPYDSEALLQELLANYPSLLAGDQMTGDVPVKWLFIAREAGIPGEEGGGNRWALDHIFIDQNGIPTLVEVKRSTDNRIRREVVGQMLDYAANAVLYWPVETIRQRFEETCRERDSEPDMVVAEFLGLRGDIDSDRALTRFWESVETNLRAGKIRLIFAADVIPPELKRIIEFLNEQMNPAEILGIEIRQYVGTGFKTLVPSVIRSSKRMRTTESRTSTKWDRESFLAALSERRGSEVHALALDILAWAATHCPILWWGEGKKDGSCFFGMTHNGVNYYAFSLWTSGRVEIPFQWLRQRLVSLDIVESFASRLNTIPGVVIPSDELTKRPSFDLALLKERTALAQFLDAVEWFVEQIKSA